MSILKDIGSLLNNKLIEKPRINIDPEIFIEYLCKKSTVFISPGDYRIDHPSVMVECKEIIPWPIKVSMKWSPEAKTIEERKNEWKSYKENELLRNFSIYLLNNWVPFGFFIEECKGADFTIIRREGIQHPADELALRINEVNKEGGGA